jgi:fibronectin type 3 domain-containing protein
MPISPGTRFRHSSSSHTHVVVVCWISAACGADATTRPPRTIPATPTRVAATALDSQLVGVTWTDTSPNETAFRVERAPKPEGPWAMTVTTQADATSATDTGLSSEQQYCYRVTAANELGDSAPSSIACVVPPAAPTRLTTKLAAGPQVILSWLTHSPSATGYEILRATDLEIPSRIGTTTVVGTYTDRDVIDGKIYYYEVRAVSPSGASGSSNISSIFVFQIDEAVR